MLESRFITSKCDKCQQANEISLQYFVGDNYKFCDKIVTVCQNCHTDFIVRLDESMIQ